MKFKLHIILTILISVLLFACKSEKGISENKITIDNTRKAYRIMFYNVENLFDTEDDPEKRDEEFTPNGTRYWSNYRYNEKLKNVYKVIIGVGEWDPPQIVGLCELENRKVLEDLISKTPLYKTDYKIIHYESPDSRGIDVGLLYREDYFTPIKHRAILVDWPKSISSRPTRDVLYVCGTTNTNDTLHIFVNHWPSRWGGQMETEQKRMYVAKIVKRQTDSIFRTNKNANIVIMGDLNDHPSDRSMMETLKAKTEFDKITNHKLYNLSSYLEHSQNLGTHKYQGQWGILDQIIVSGALLDPTNSVYTSVEDIHIFDADFLLEKDDKFTGKRVNRTYIGFKFHGGFSDHLPTYIDLNFNE